jgi:hypothetical protein
MFDTVASAPLQRRMVAIVGGIHFIAASPG